MTEYVDITLHASLVRVEPGTFLGADRFRVYRDAIDGARFNREVKANFAPIDKLPAILSRLRSSGFHVRIAEDIKKALQHWNAQQWHDFHAVRDRINAIEKEFRARSGKSYYPFQKTGSIWLALRRSALLADEMGLGKTLQAISAIPALAPVLIVCPKTLKDNWVAEIQLWRPYFQTTVLSGRDSFRFPKVGEIVITNYDILRGAHKSGCHELSAKGERPAGSERCEGCHPFLDGAPEGLVVVLDEAQRIKNSAANRSKNVRALCDRAIKADGRAWALTGTPVENDPIDLWTILTIIGAAHEAFGTWKKFIELSTGRLKVMSGAHGVRYGYDWGDPDDRFAEHLERVMLRRTASDVLTQLPERRYQRMTVEVDKTTLQSCDAALKEIGGIGQVDALVEKMQAKATFEAISSIRAAIATAKIPGTLKLLDEMEKAKLSPIIVFSMHRAPIDTLKERPGWSVITGDVSAEERTKIVKRFQAGDLKGLACTIQAAGEGITLTRSNQVVFFDRAWNPAANAQAEARPCRIGQERSVLITLVEIDHPLEKRINTVLLKKVKISDGTVNAARKTDDVEADSPDENIRAQLEALQEEVWSGRALRTVAETDADRKTLDALGRFDFESLSDERIATDLFEQAHVIGLSAAQWELARTVAGRGSEPTKPREPETQMSLDADLTAEPEAFTMQTTMPKTSPQPKLKIADKYHALDAAFGALDEDDRVDAIEGLIDQLDEDDRVDLFDSIEADYCVDCGQGPFETARELKKHKCPESSDDGDEDDAESSEGDADG